jgi:ABC-2 type transport system permease protein
VSGALSAFAYLSVRSFRNRALMQLRRLRSPRYVIAVAVACGYFFILLHRPSDPSVDVPSVIPSGPAGGGVGIELLTACALALFTAKWWIMGSDNSSLAFTAAEVQFLFPAPLRRRTLVLYKIGRMQLKLLISAILITILARRAGAQLSPVLRVLSVWLLFCTLSLHQIAAALVRTGAAQRGRGLRRNAIPIVVVATAMLILAGSAVRAWPGAHGIEDLPAALTRVALALRSPLPNAVLAPFHLIIAPSYATTSGAWLLALGPAICVLALHMVWVLRADTVFEEAAVEASARLAARDAASRARNAGAVLPTSSVVDKVSGSMAAVRLERAPPSGVRLRRILLPLAPKGDPAVAILWKNTLALLRGLRLRTMLLVCIVLSTFVAAIRQLGLMGDAPTGGGTVLLGALAFVAALFLIVLGPLAVRNDLRQDLLHIDLLRTFPLRGRAIVFAEIASSTLALTLVQWLLLAASYVFLSNAPQDADAGMLSLFQTEFPDRLTMLAVVVAVLPIINGASFLIQNTAALLFPEWMRLGAGGMGGLEVIGQRLIGFGGSIIALGTLLAIPSLVVAGVLATWQGDAMPSPVSLLLAVTVGVIVGATEIYLAVIWLGRRFEQTDVNAIPRG